MKLRTEVGLLDCLDGLEGLVREGLDPLDGTVLTGFALDGLTPLETDEDETDALFGDAGRDPGVGKD